MANEIKAKSISSSSDFDTFVREHYELVMWGLIAGGAAQHEADDATLQAMIIAGQQWPLESPKAFVRRVARNTLISSLRKAKADQKRQDKIFAQPAESYGTAEEKVVFETEVQYVLSVLATLPKRQREVMALKVEGLSDQEIAEVTRMKLATVQSNVRHARIKLKQLFSDRKE